MSRDHAVPQKYREAHMIIRAVMLCRTDGFSEASQKRRAFGIDLVGRLFQE